jgi:hypothetical protein
MEWLQGLSLEDLLDSGVDLTEPVEAEADWPLLDEVREASKLTVKGSQAKLFLQAQKTPMHKVG